MSLAVSAQQITGIVVSDASAMLINREPAVHIKNVMLVAHSGRRYHLSVLISTFTCLDVVLMFFGCFKYNIDSTQVLINVFPHKHPTNKYM